MWEVFALARSSINNRRGPAKKQDGHVGWWRISVCVYIDIFINKRQASVTEMLCFQVGRKVLSHVVPSR